MTEPSRPVTEKVPWRRSLLAVAVLALAGATPAFADPARDGAFTEPFEEGGAGQPRCERQEDGRLECKPTAVSSVPLVDGRFQLRLGLTDAGGGHLYHWLDDAAEFVVVPASDERGVLRIDGRWTREEIAAARLSGTR